MYKYAVRPVEMVPRVNIVPNSYFLEWKITIVSTLCNAKCLPYQSYLTFFFRTSFDRARISSVTFYKVHPNYVAKNSAQTGMRSRLDTVCWKLFCSVSKALLWLWVKCFYFTLCMFFCCACTDFVSWMDTHIPCFPFTNV